MAEHDHNEELEDKGVVFGRFGDEEYDGFQAFLWTMPWPGFGQRYDSVTTTFVSATGKQPWWDWGYYMVLFQIIVILTAISGIIWYINIQDWKGRNKKKSEDSDDSS